MKKKKLKRLFFLCLLILIVVIIVTSCDMSKIVGEEEVEIEQNINVEASHNFEKLDYNNLTSIQKKYIESQYQNRVKFTEKGVEIYYEDVSSGNIYRIITSKWPEDKWGVFIPKPDYKEEDLDKIEYNDKSIEVYINNAKKSDVKEYLKEIKKYNFNKDESKNDGNVMLEYKIYDEIGNSVKIRFMYESKELKISAEKVN